MSEPLRAPTTGIPRQTAPAPRAYTCPVPGCGWEGEFDRTFVAWCRKCGHGADPLAAAPEPGHESPRRAARRKAREAAAVERGQQLFDDLAAGADPRPTTGMRATVAVFSVAVHIPFLLLVGGCTVWLTAQPHNWVVWGVSLLGFLLAFAVRPRVGRGPRGADWHTRTEFPELFALFDQVAAAVGARPVHAVAFDADFNAATATLGVLRRRVLILGVPLWEVLTGPERIALLAHEFGHQVNGDATAGTLGASAQRSLMEWAILLDPRGHRRQEGASQLGAAAFVAHVLLPVVLFPFWITVLALRWAHAKLWTATKPRAEYLADAIAARVASTAAAEALMNQLVLARTAGNYLERYRNRRGEEELWDDLRTFLRELPEHERERVFRNDEAAGTAVDASHPPNRLRRRFPAAREQYPGEIEAAAVAWDGIDAELDPVRAKVKVDLRRP